jgi:hypothetical protein
MYTSATLLCRASSELKSVKPVLQLLFTSNNAL